MAENDGWSQFLQETISESAKGASEFFGITGVTSKRDKEIKLAEIEAQAKAAEAAAQVDLANAKVLQDAVNRGKDPGIMPRRSPGGYIQRPRPVDRVRLSQARQNTQNYQQRANSSGSAGPSTATVGVLVATGLGLMVFGRKKG